MISRMICWWRGHHWTGLSYAGLTGIRQCERCGKKQRMIWREYPPNLDWWRGPRFLLRQK